MATIRYLLQSKSENSPVYIRLTLNRTTQIKRKTGLFINSKNWSNSTGLPKQNEAASKSLASKLRKLKDFILDNLNESILKNQKTNVHF